MAVPNEGNTNLPSDASARYFWGGWVEAVGQFFAARMDNATAKNLRVSLFDGAANQLVGQKAMAGSLPVAVASDQGNLPVTLATALAGEDQTNNRLKVEMQPADADSVLESLLAAQTGASANSTTIDMKGYKSLAVDVQAAGTGAIVTFQMLLDDGATNWTAVALSPVGGGAAVTATTAAQVGMFFLAGPIPLAQFRVVLSAQTALSTTVKTRKHPR